jgi:autotransporter-associated beta strand protein
LGPNVGAGVLYIRGGTLDNSYGSDLTLASNNAQVWDGDFPYAGGANNLNLGTGPVILGGNRIVTVAANTLTVGGAISGTFGLTKSGSGTLILSGMNSYSGGAFVTAGTLEVTNPTALPDGSSLTIDAGGTFVFNGAATAVPSGAVAVPEPGTLVLLAAASFVAFAAWKRKRI